MPPTAPGRHKQHRTGFAPRYVDAVAVAQGDFTTLNEQRAQRLNQLGKGQLSAGGLGIDDAHGAAQSVGLVAPGCSIAWLAAACRDGLVNPRCAGTSLRLGRVRRRNDETRPVRALRAAPSR